MSKTDIVSVTANHSGFIAGNYHEADGKPFDLPRRIAKPFLPPYGDQLSEAGAGKTVAAEAAAETETPAAG